MYPVLVYIVQKQLTTLNVKVTLKNYLLTMKHERSRRYIEYNHPHHYHHYIIIITFNITIMEPVLKKVEYRSCDMASVLKIVECVKKSERYLFFDKKEMKHRMNNINLTNV